jgi:hypothetical protein
MNHYGQKIHENLLRYGKILKDIEYEDKDGCHRIRIILRFRCIYYDHMLNGEVIECYRLPTREDQYE